MLETKEALIPYVMPHLPLPEEHFHNMNLRKASKNLDVLYFERDFLFVWKYVTRIKAKLDNPDERSDEHFAEWRAKWEYTQSFQKDVWLVVHCMLQVVNATKIIDTRPDTLKTVQIYTFKNQAEQRPIPFEPDYVASINIQSREKNEGESMNKWFNSSSLTLH